MFQALPSSKLPLVFRNPLQKLVTSLPYIDDELDRNTLKKVQELINIEMKSMDKIDYLVDLPMPVTRDYQKITFDQVFNRKPEEKLNDIHEVQSSIQEIDMFTQYSQVNLINQELLAKYGKDSWTLMLNSQDKEKQRLQKEIDKEQQKVNELNAHRKYEQHEVKYQLNAVKAKINELIISNEILEIECHKLEEQVGEETKKKVKLI
ncbi:hypothetical protein pb186bvf_019150 [Paramecium bursaria]